MVKKFLSKKFVICSPLMALINVGVIVLTILLGIDMEVEPFYIAMVVILLLIVIGVLIRQFIKSAHVITITEKSVKTALFDKWHVKEIPMKDFVDIKVFLSPVRDNVVAFSTLPAPNRPLTGKESKEFEKAQTRITCTESEFKLISKLVGRPIRNIFIHG